MQAAVFNHTDIVFALIESGASLDYKNAQGNYWSIFLKKEKKLNKVMGSWY